MQQINAWGEQVKPTWKVRSGFNSPPHTCYFPICTHNRKQSWDWRQGEQLMTRCALHLLSCGTGVKWRLLFWSQGLIAMNQTACHSMQEMTWHVCFGNRINLILWVGKGVPRRAWKLWKCFVFHILNRPLLKARQNYLQWDDLQGEEIKCCQTEIDWLPLQLCISFL